MSIYRCDRHGRKVDGRLDAAYPTVLRGGVRYSSRLRLCGPCLTEFLGSSRPQLRLADDDDDEFELDLCDSCRKTFERQEQRSSVFVTAYKRGEDRADYYAVVCEPCAGNIIQEWSLSL